MRGGNTRSQTGNRISILFKPHGLYNHQGYLVQNAVIKHDPTLINWHTNQISSPKQQHKAQDSFKSDRHKHQATSTEGNPEKSTASERRGTGGEQAGTGTRRRRSYLGGEPLVQENSVGRSGTAETFMGSSSKTGEGSSPRRRRDSAMKLCYSQC